MGHVGDRDDAARPRHRAAHQGRRQRRSPRSTSGWPPASSASRAAACRRSPGRATARAAASTATSATSCPATATSPTPSTAPTVAKVWELRRVARSPARASRPRRSSRRSTTARSRACCRSASTRPCRRPTANFTARGARQARVLRGHRLLPVRVRPPRRRRAARLAARGGRGHLDQRRGPDHQDQRRRRRRPARPAATGRSCSTSPSASARASTSRTANTEEIFDELCRASPGGTADYTGATWQRIEDEMGLFWPVPEAGHPGTPRLYEGGQFYHPDGKARFHGVPYRAVGRGRRRRVPGAGSPPAGSSASTCRAPRPAASPRSSPSTPSRCARCTRSSPSRSASPTATSSPSRPGAATITLPAARGHHDPARHRVHPLPLARRARPPTSSPTGPSTRCRRCPSSRSPPCASNAGGTRPRRRDLKTTR